MLECFFDHSLDLDVSCNLMQLQSVFTLFSIYLKQKKIITYHSYYSCSPSKELVLITTFKPNENLKSVKHCFQNTSSILFCIFRIAQLWSCFQRALLSKELLFPIAFLKASSKPFRSNYGMHRTFYGYSEKNQIF